jgi:hypothetical protein
MPHELAQFLDLVVIISAHDGIHIEPEAIRKFCFERVKRADAVESFLPISRHTADLIVSFTITIERDVQVEIEFGMGSEGPVNNFINPSLDQSVGRNDYAIDTVLLYKRIDDFRHIAAQRGFTAGQPEVGNRGHGARNLFDLLKSQVTRLIQLFMIETRFAKRVAARSNEQDDCPKVLFAPGGTQELD